MTATEARKERAKILNSIEDEARAAYREKRDKLKVDHAVRLGDLEDIIAAEDNKRETAAKARAGAVPQFVRDFFNRLQHGVDYGSGGLKFRWASPDQKWIIWTIGGHTGWSGRGETKYYPARHMLSCMVLDDGKSNGMSLLHATQSGNQVEGKLSAAQFKDWQRIALGVAAPTKLRCEAPTGSSGTPGAYVGTNSRCKRPATGMVGALNLCKHHIKEYQKPA